MRFFCCQVYDIIIMGVSIYIDAELYAASIWYDIHQELAVSTGLEVIKLEYKLRLKIKRNDWLLADTCPQTANHCALF